MSKLVLSPEEHLYVLNDIKAICTMMHNCDGCQFYIPGEGCPLAHLPERWMLDDLMRKVGDLDD